MFHNFNNTVRNLDLDDKIEALHNTYRLARRFVLGLYGYKGEADTRHPYHYRHPEHIESEILAYAEHFAGENEGFWMVDLYKNLFVLDRLNDTEIYTEQMDAIYKDMVSRDPRVKKEEDEIIVPKKKVTKKKVTKKKGGK